MAVALLQSPTSPLPSSTTQSKVISWAHIHMIHGALRVGTTLSSTERFIKPFHRRLIQCIENAYFPAYSLGGQVPDIFFKKTSEREEYGPFGAYFSVKDLLNTAEQCHFKTTLERSPGYQGGDMYTPLLMSVQDSQDYVTDVGKSLFRFNGSPLVEGAWCADNSKASGPTTPNFSIPGFWGFS